MMKLEPGTERKPFKEWFDREAAKSLARQVAAVYPRFDQQKFVRLASRGLDDLEFAARVRRFSDSLAELLPDSYPKAIETVVESLPERLPDCESPTDGWLQWPLGQFIADYGIDHFDQSIEAMTELTQRFSAEFAVRPFVERFPERTFDRLLSLTSHSSPHVRRWCSEGVRPRLPWGKKLTRLVADPAPIFPILDRLKDDDEPYVRRSVANNLNDIAKDHQSKVVKVCKAWSRSGNPDREWVIQRACRTLVKEGYPPALALMGFRPPKQLTSSLKVTPKGVSVGEQITLKTEIGNKSKSHQKLMIDYVMHYVRKNDKSTGKVFKWTTIEIPAGEVQCIEKQHSMRATTVRSLYPGRHLVELQVNGQRLAKTSFILH